MVYDDSLFTGPTNNPTWRADYVPDDIVTPITALWVDRGASPTGYGRSDDPSLAAAATFAGALAQAGREGRRRARQRRRRRPARRSSPAPRAPPSPRSSSGSSTSATTRRAEVLAHHVGLAVSGDGSFDGGAAGVLSTLQALGVDDRRRRRVRRLRALAPQPALAPPPCCRSSSSRPARPARPPHA